MSKFWKILRQKRLIISVFVLFMSAAATVVTPAHTLAISGQTLVALTNTERAANGLGSLTWNAALGSSAWLKAQDMCAKGYWAHTAPDGTTGWTFMSKAGYAYTTAGENLAKGFSNDPAVVAGWMASPGHRANILNVNYREIGIATADCAFQGAQTTLVVAHYGATATPAPKPAAIPQAPSQQAAQPIAKPAVLADQAQSLSSNAAPTQHNGFKTGLEFGRKLWKLLWNQEQAVELFQ